MERRYKVIVEKDEDGVHVATAPALPGVVEQGDTANEAFENMGAAIRFTLDSMSEEGERLPRSDATDSREVRNIELVIYTRRAGDFHLHRQRDCKGIGETRVQGCSSEWLACKSQIFWAHFINRTCTLR